MDQNLVKNTPQYIILFDCEGEVNLKNIQVQARSLILHRFLKVICDYQINISYDAIMLTLWNFDATPPIEIRTVTGSFRCFVSNYMDFADAILQQIPMKGFTEIFIHIIWKLKKMRIPL